MASSLRTFLRYYLPATLKLLQSRAALEGEGGEQMQIAQRIREAMGQVQTAFHRQLDALNEFRFINLESEMDVLADMLAGDGLIASEKPAAKDEISEEAKEDPFGTLFAQEGR